MEQINLIKEELPNFKKWAKKKGWKIIKVIRLPNDKIIVIIGEKQNGKLPK